MFIMIPGEVVAVFTFPGVVMHEVAHRLVCDLLNVPVYDVKYFIIHKDAAGYVYHARTSLGKNFLIAIAPLFVNTIFCMLFTFPLAAKNFIHCRIHPSSGDPLSPCSSFTPWIIS